MKVPGEKRKFRRAARGDKKEGEEEKRGKKGKGFCFSYRRSERYLRVFLRAKRARWSGLKRGRKMTTLGSQKGLSN